MELQWRFKINGTDCEEPIGWDSLSITLQRDATYHGLENVFSEDITFWDNGAQIIKTEFELNGIDAELGFTSEYSCDGGVTWTFFITGILNAFFYSIINNEVTIKIEPSGFHRKVKNRLDTPVNLNSNVSIGGEPMSNIQPFDLGLHSKTIQELGKFNYGPQVDIPGAIPGYTLIGERPENYTMSYNPPSNPPRIVERSFSQTCVPEVIITSEIETYSDGVVNSLTNSTTYPGDNTQIQPTVFYHIANLTASSFDFTGLLHFALEVELNLVAPPPTPKNIDFTISNLTFYIKAGSTIYTEDSAGPFSVSTSITPAVPSYTLLVENFDLQLNEPGLSLISPDTVQVYVKYDIHYEFERPGISEADYEIELVHRCYINDFDSPNNKSLVSVLANSKQPPSTTKAFLIHEAFAKLSESITDEIDSFRSDFFGRTNSQPYQYEENGCGSWTANTNFINIRKILNRDNEYYPIVTTFNNQFNASDAVWNLGMRIEKDNTGKEFIRIEPKDFFYNPNALLTLFNISDLKKYPAQDLIYNNFRIGYDKWNLNVTGSNALDEVNSVHNYSLPIRNANKTLIVSSNYVGAGYVIEQARRLQFKNTPTNDFELDNNMAFICTNRGVVTSDLYSDPAVSTSYQAGEVSERDENFSLIEKVIDPATVYNLRISPTRNALNWYNYISASIYKAPASDIKFINGEGNYIENDIMTDICDISSNGVYQNQDINSENLTNNSTPIYLPEYLEFTYPLSFSEFVNIMNNSEKAIQISCNDSAQYIGFIKTLKYSPNANGGIGEFKLIRGNCFDGDFNNDFNNDFFTGNC